MKMKQINYDAHHRFLKVDALKWLQIKLHERKKDGC